MFDKAYDQSLLSDTFELSDDDLALVLGGDGPSGAQPDQSNQQGGGPPVVVMPPLVVTPGPPPPPPPPVTDILGPILPKR
ncbi:MAG: hypothetical protein RL033_910 [Pseudomonadota bacterium]